MSVSDTDFPYLLDSDNKELNLQDLSFDSESDFLIQIRSWKIQMKSLDEVDAGVDPMVFKEELSSYIRDSFRAGKKNAPELVFCEAGYLYRTTYWIFEAKMFSESIYALVVRDLPLTEFVLVDKSHEIMTGDHGEIIELSPGQAAVYDLFDPGSE